MFTATVEETSTQELTELELQEVAGGLNPQPLPPSPPPDRVFAFSLATYSALGAARF